LFNISKFNQESFVAESLHTIDVPNDKVLRGHNFSPHSNVNFIARRVLSIIKKIWLTWTSAAKGKIVDDQWFVRCFQYDSAKGWPTSRLNWGYPSMGGRMCVPKGAQHDQHPTNQAVAKLGTVPGAQ